MQEIIIWLYHRVLPEKGRAAVDIETFGMQLAHLQESGYTFINTEDLKLWFDNRINRNKKYVMLTFDDGWADNYFWATPVLAKYAAKAVVAINTGLINKDVFRLRNVADYKVIDSKTALEDAAYGRDFSSFLTWEELQEMSDTGIWDIQAHGNSHFGCYFDFRNVRGFFPDKRHWTMRFALGEEPFPGAPRADFISDLCSPRTVLCDEFKENLREARDDYERRELCRLFPNPLRRVEDDDTFEARISANLSECRRLIQQNMGKTADSLFWPWGQHSEASRRIAAGCGYTMLFTTEKKTVAADTSKLMIPRIPAPASSSKFKLQRLVYSSSFLRSFR